MTPFSYERPADAAAAVAAVQMLDAKGVANVARPQGRFLAGGTNLVDLLKANVVSADSLVDIRRLALRSIQADPEGGLTLGAPATNAETAEHPLVRARYPLLRSAILAGASPQIRNMATNGGNLLQRTRCVYFCDVAVPCNKRLPGSGCPAVEGLARQHAILGASAHCVATHPSDLCVALAALDAQVHVVSSRGRRVIPFTDFHRLPEDRPELDTTLSPDELITHLVLPSNDFGRHSTYLKVRERSSYAFALVSVAAALRMDNDGHIAEARVALGGVAHRPWRATEAEASLVGQSPNQDSFAKASSIALRDARACGSVQPDQGNAFKIPLARRAIVRALEMATQGIATNTGEDAVEGEPT